MIDNFDKYYIKQIFFGELYTAPSSNKLSKTCTKGTRQRIINT